MTEEHKELARLRAKAWRAANPERYKEIQRAHYHKHKGKLNSKRKAKRAELTRAETVYSKVDRLQHENSRLFEIALACATMCVNSVSEYTHLETVSERGKAALRLLGMSAKEVPTYGDNPDLLWSNWQEARRLAEAQLAEAMQP